MWLVSTLLSDHWFDDLNEALAAYQASPKTRTYPRLDSGWKLPAGAFETVKARA